MKICLVNLFDLDPPRNGGLSRVAYLVSSTLAEYAKQGNLLLAGVSASSSGVGLGTQAEKLSRYYPRLNSIVLLQILWLAHSLA